MASPQTSPPRPVPPAQEGRASVALRPEPDFTVPGVQAVPGAEQPGNWSSSPPEMIQPGMPMGQGYPVDPSMPPAFAPQDYSSYMQNSGGVTESPVLGRRPMDNPLFGPMLMFETNSDNGLGYDEAYHRANARLPWHVVPGNSVLIGDLSASLTNNSGELYNFGLVWRNYDASRNRIFGWNVFGDIDDGRDDRSWNRLGFGFESLGKYIDFRGNGYIVTGDDSVLLNDRLDGNLVQGGNSVFRTRNQTRDNAYSGFDLETGGPLPILGRRGINGYVGGYYLDNDMGHETVGFSGRIQALVTESATVNVNYTNDDTFGVNSWVSVSYTIPNYGEKTILQAKNVRDRLADPVYRSNRIHTSVDNVNVPEAVINDKTGNPYNIVYVNPNLADPGIGTFEMPFNTMQVAANTNNPNIDIIRVTPNADDSGTNLTMNGGIQLFDCQALVSSIVDYPLFTENDMTFSIPGIPTASNLGPLISNPTMGAGGSVVRLANENTVWGMRIDGANAAGTVFGTGITNPLPRTDARIVDNVFTNYETAVNLQLMSGNIILDGNTATGLSGASNSGLVLTTAAGSMTNLLVRNNTVTNNGTVGISVTVGPNATLNADNPQGFAGIGNPAVQATGIVDNTVTNGGQGIEVIAQPGSVANVLAEDNISTGNTFDGFSARADNSTFNLVSLRRNTFSSNLQNGTLLHYLNGGTFRAVTEDLNGDGLLDPGEDLNGNGLLDEGIAANTMNNNSLIGLCIFGEDNSTGVFDIGGPLDSLGNTFLGNTQAGIAVDLQDDATAQIDALFNTIQGGSAVPGLTIVMDFIDPGQGSVVDALGRTVNPFDVSLYGFSPADFGLVTSAIRDTVVSYYRNIPTMGQDPRSPIPDGMELNLDFVIGDTGAVPLNGATEYYAMTIGDSAVNLGGLAGQAADIGNIRNALGTGPGLGLGAVPQANGASAMAVYTNQINQFSPLLSPPNAIIGPAVPEPLIVEDPSRTPQFAITALTSGNLTFTRRAIGLVAAHELGHTLSLRHIENGTAVTPTGANAVMATPAIDAPIQVLLEPAEFAFTGTNPGELPGEAAFQQESIAQLANAVGLRVAGGATRNGITVAGTDNARLLPSTFNNNTIIGATEHGINIDMQDNAQVEGLTIQGNTISNGGGQGIRLAASDNAVINADNTIGGTGANTYRTNVFSQSNTISGNAGDGFQAVVSNGGTIRGNLLNNSITDNGGNGVSLFVDGSGTLDFGTPASNRLIRGNTITGNGGRGIQLVSTVAAGQSGVINAVVQDNEISNNAGGGIVSQMFGPSTDNVVNLTVGGLPTEANSITGNGNVGVGFSVNGNAKGNFTITNSTISGTTNGPDPLTDGDGIYLSRTSSSLLTATIESVTSTGNAGNGLRVDVQGNDRTDPNQPMSGTINTVDWNNNLFTSNGANGALFRVRGDAQLLADGQNNVLNNNAQDGLEITTSENASFGDPTVGLPPGRRVLLSGTTATGNGVDGISINATESSRVLAEITSIRTAAGSSGAHAALNTNGDSNISNNGSDGIHITTTGGSSDVLITADTGNTTISGNGTVAGGNGIRWDASGTADALVRVTNTTILNSIAGAIEDPANNGNGILDPGEDINGDGILQPLEDVFNADINVENGDGIQYNVFGNATSTLVVGGVNSGNVIQSNGDDGIAITATGSGTSVSRPVVTILENTIGGQRNGVDAGNGGDGVSLNILGGTAVGVPPGAVDFTGFFGDGDGLTFNGGVEENGPIVQLTMTDNLISNNSQRGVNLILQGAAGERDRENGNILFDPVRITMTGNTISSNGDEGIYFRADSEMNQSRFVYLANPTVGPPDARVLLFNNLDYNPFRPEFLALNVGSINGTTAYLPPYLNLRTVQNTFLTVTGNTIQNNGVNTVTGEGMFVEVGTGSYVAADVRNNTFGGNLEEDFHTESFLSAGNTFTSVENTAADTFDFVYLDDTAQLDLRFTNNSGNQIDVTADGANYTNFDPLKAQFFGALGVVNRSADLFQIDDGNNLDNPNNVFINFGITQDIDGIFTNGGYNLRGIADPLFPNLGFPPFLP